MRLFNSHLFDSQLTVRNSVRRWRGRDLGERDLGERDLGERDLGEWVSTFSDAGVIR